MQEKEAAPVCTKIELKFIVKEWKILEKIYRIKLPIKISNFFQGRGKAKIHPGILTVCEDLNFRSNEEIGKKGNFYLPTETYSKPSALIASGL